MSSTIEKYFSLGQNLKNLRNYKDITLETFAKEIEIKLENLRTYEYVEINPPLDNMIKIAQYFGVSLDFLILGKDSNYPYNLKMLYLSLKIDSFDQSKRFQIESTANSLLQGREKADIKLDTFHTGLSNSIHENIKAIRTEKEISQQVLSNYLGIKQGVVSRYEKNVTPSINRLIKLSKFFGVSIHALATSQKLNFHFIDGHLEKTILQADQLLTLEEHKMLIHLMEAIINNTNKNLIYA